MNDVGIVLFLFDLLEREPANHVFALSVVETQERALRDVVSQHAVDREFIAEKRHVPALE